MMRPTLARTLLLVSLPLLPACGGGGGGGGLVPIPPVLPTPENSWVEVTDAAGLGFAPGAPIAAPGGGVCSGDYDRDGFVDLFVVRDSRLPTLLFRNQGDGTFKEVSVAAGVSVQGNTIGPSFADLDGDGWLDLFVCGTNGTLPQVFHNQQDGTFKNITKTAGFNLTGESWSVAFGDYDRDGDLDAFICRWERDNNPKRTPNEHLWRNNGDLTFTDVTTPSGIAKTIRVNPKEDLTFTANFADVNSDGWPDLLIAGDFRTSRIYINNQDTTFTDTTTEIIDDENAMGSTVGDYDNDGDLDWFVSSIFDRPALRTPVFATGNRLYRNAGDGTFDEVSEVAGVRDGYWGWAATFGDFDNDGHLDIVHTNGWGRLGFEKDPTVLFMSNGDGTFTESAKALGLDDRGQGRGLVSFDYDNDGDLDLFIYNHSQPWRLYRNDLNTGNRLTVQLQGKAPNSEAIGARIYVTIGQETQMRELRCGCNYISQDPAYAHFGLGSASTVDELQVVWPDGSQVTRKNVAANQFLVIKRQ